MRDRRFGFGWLVGFGMLLIALPHASEARITFVQEDGIDQNGDFEYEFIGDVVVSPDRAYVYTTTAYAPNQIVVYAREADTGRIDERAVVDPQTGSATILAISSPDGAFLYSLDYATGQITTFARNAGTGLLTRLGVVQPPTSGINQQWQGMTISPDGANVYTTAAGSAYNLIGVYARDASTGLLTLVELESGFPGLFNPIGIRVTPDGAHVYVGCYRATGGIVVLARDAITGTLSAVQDIEDGDTGTLRYQFSVDVAPDGFYVYFAGGGQGITVFKRDVATGVLTRVQTTVDSSDHEVIVTADGTRVYGCGASQGIRGYARNPLSGRLTLDEQHAPFDEGFAPPLFCFGMAMTSDGRHFYTDTTYDTDVPGHEYAYTIGVFRRLNTSCSATPLTGCQTPASAASTLLLRNTSTGSGRISWKSRGPGSAADFGDPVDGATDAQLCLYDNRGAVVGIVAPGSAPCLGDRPCWQRHSTVDLRYVDSKRLRDGIKTVKLQQRAPGEARFDYEARGGAVHLSMPMLGTVTVQLQLSDGTTSSCWSATYSSPSRNYSYLYRARSDP